MHKTIRGQALVLSTVADGVSRTVESIGNKVSEQFFEPVINLGVTGLSRAGKTVFITSFVANLLDRGRMGGMQAVSSGRVSSVVLRPQPDDTVARFDYETHLSDMLGTTPAWPQSTRSVSQLRLSFRVQPAGLLGAVTGPKTVHLDIIDYPGEWLLDLALLDKDYDQWSAEVLARMSGRDVAKEFTELAAHTDAQARFEEPAAKTLATSFTSYLTAAREAGFYDCTPGRFLLPGDLAGSPALTFAPLPKGDSPRRSLRREMARRYEAYKSKIVKPFFRDHFSKIDRQVVLVDALGAIHSGPQAVEDLRGAMADILGAFRPGRNALLSQLLLGKRVDKILFAATKADHLHQSQHWALTGIMQALTRNAADKAQFAGAQTSAMAIASLRATVEETRNHNGEDLDLVRGILQDTGKEAALFAGEMPKDPSKILMPAKDGAQSWLNQDFSVMSFAPYPVELEAGMGPPHIRLDRAAEFLIGDRL